MDALDAYSLLLSLIAGSASILLGLRARFILRGELAHLNAHPGLPKALRLTRVASSLVVLGALSGFISVLVHAFWAHGPGARTPMSTAELVNAHPSFLVIGLVVAAGFASVLAARAKIATRARLQNAA